MHPAVRQSLLVGAGINWKKNQFPGAAGVWLARNAVGQVVPNVAVSSEVSGNLLSAPRRMFNSTTFWSKANVTVTDANATDADGVANNASTLLFQSGGNLNPPAMTITAERAGTYTLATTAMRNAGSDQTTRTQLDSGALTTQTWGAAFSRQSLQYNLTAGSHTISALLGNGSTTSAIILDRIELFSGAVDPGRFAEKGDLYVGRHAFDNRGSIVNNALDLTAANAFGLIQLPALVSVTGATVMVLASKTAVASDPIQAILSNWSNYQNWTVCHEESGGPEWYWGGTDITGSQVSGAQFNGLWDFKDAGWVIQTLRYTGTNVAQFIDDLKLLTRSVTKTAQSLGDLGVGHVAGGFSASHKVKGLVLWTYDITDAEQAAAAAKMRRLAMADGIETVSTNRLLVAEGHSFAYRSGSYSYLYGANRARFCLGAVYANTGDSLAQVQARVASIVALAKVGRRIVVPIDIGTNDLPTYPGGSDAAAAAAYIAALASVHDQLRAACGGGVIKTIAVGILPTTNPALTAPQIAAFNARRAIVNAAMATWEGVHCDGFAAVNTDPDMGPDGASDNTTYYDPDKVHPSAGGNARMGTYIWPLLDTLLAT